MGLGRRVQSFSGLGLGLHFVSLALACELHYLHDFFRVSLGLACGVYFIRFSVAEGFTSTGFVWVWLVLSWPSLSLGFVGVGCGVFGSDFFRVPLGLAGGLSSSGLLWRRASPLRVSLGLFCLGSLGLRDFAGLTSLLFLQARLSASLL